MITLELWVYQRTACVVQSEPRQQTGYGVPERASTFAQWYSGSATAQVAILSKHQYNKLLVPRKCHYKGVGALAFDSNGCSALCVQLYNMETLASSSKSMKANTLPRLQSSEGV